MSFPVPLTPRYYWTVNRDGQFVSGVSADYRIEVEHDDGILRIERDFAPVPVSEAERNLHRDLITRAMRRTQPDWRWNGPPIPETKPPFQGIVAGRQGRIWVRLWTEARPPATGAGDSWPAPLRYDAFEPDGTYLGAVVPPEGFADHPEPVFDGDDVWAITRDALGVERVVRFRIEVES